MNEFEKKLYDDLLEELAIYADLGAPPVRRLTGAVASIAEAVGKLKDYVLENPFASIAEEIEFFKVTKPLFTAEQHYAMEIFTIESSRPLNDAALLTVFYEKELAYVRRFFEQNKFLYAYYQGDMKELDELLFVRGAKPADIPVPDLIGLDPAFNTCGDNLFAKFRAFERLQAYLTELLYPSALPQPNMAVMKWPGDKADLTELGYGIYCWMRAHQSKASTKEVINWLEKSFSVTLSRPYGRFVEIKMRKVSSRTKFWDEARELLVKYMADGDV